MQIEILDEQERSGHWRFAAQVLDADGSLHAFTLTMAWPDYNLWSPAGSDTPAAVAMAALRYIVTERPPAELPPRIDASMARRLDPGADAAIPGLI